MKRKVTIKKESIIIDEKKPEPIEVISPEKLQMQIELEELKVFTDAI